MIEVKGNTEKEYIQAELTISKKKILKKSQAVLLTCFFSLDTITALWHHLTD